MKVRPVGVFISKSIIRDYSNQNDKRFPANLNGGDLEPRGHFVKNLIFLLWENGVGSQGHALLTCFSVVLKSTVMVQL